MLESGISDFRSFIQCGWRIQWCYAVLHFSLSTICMSCIIETFAVACIWSSAICLPVVVPFDYVLLWVFDSHSWQVAEGPEAA